jgi:hypothetical protein
VRLVDAVFRQGHLSERALIEAVMTGDRPLHLDRCEICADRAVQLGRWLDEVRTAGHEAADAAFTPERLTAQHAQILRKIEQADQPSRVIAFPSFTRADAREGGGRRVAAAWVGVAAAAGLAIGVVGGQVSARLAYRPIAAPTAVATAPDVLPPIGAESTDPLTGPAGRSILDMNLEMLDVDTLRIIDQSTPSMVRASVNRGGD